MWPYFKIGAQTVFSYKPKTLQLDLDGTPCTLSPLTLVFANGRQYGSNFKIAPKANLSDGELDMVIVQDAPKWKLALATPSFFTTFCKEPPSPVAVFKASNASALVA